MRVQAVTSAPASSGAMSRPKGLRIIFFILLLDVIGISILWPVTAFIVQRYSADALTLTVLTSLYSCAQFFAAPLMGKLGDRHGRRPILIISLLGSAFGYVLFGIGGALWVLMLSRLIDGFTAGNHSVAASFLSDVSTPQTRTQNFSLFGIAWGIGLIVGPALGAVLGQVDLTAPAWLAAGLSLLAMVLSVVYLPESLPPEKRHPAPLRAADFNPFLTILQMVRQAVPGRLFLVLCLFNFVFNGYSSTEALYLLKKFAVQPWQVGSLLALAGLAMVLSFKLLPRLTRAVGQQNVMIMALCGVALGLLGTCLVPHFSWLYLIVSLRMVAGVFLFPTIGALLAAHVDTREHGAMMGVNTALQSAMCIIGPLWAGTMYDYLSPSAPYWMGALILLLTAAYVASLPLQPSVND